MDLYILSKHDAETYAQLGTAFVIDAGTYEIACLFTSAHYGRDRDSNARILASTRRACQDLVDQVKKRKTSPNLASCKINAGKFAVRFHTVIIMLHSDRLCAQVEWAKSKAVMTEVFGAAGLHVTVYDQ